LNPELLMPREQIAGFCRQHHIRRLSLFGSALRSDFGPDSDVDVLVEFAKGHEPGFAFFALQDELSHLIGHRVEWHTPNFLSRYFRGQVMQEAQVVYGQR